MHNGILFEKPATIVAENTMHPNDPARITEGSRHDPLVSDLPFQGFPADAQPVHGDEVLLFCREGIQSPTFAGCAPWEPVTDVRNVVAQAK